MPFDERHKCPHGWHSSNRQTGTCWRPHRTPRSASQHPGSATCSWQCRHKWALVHWAGGCHSGTQGPAEEEGGRGKKKVSHVVIAAKRLSYIFILLNPLDKLDFMLFAVLFVQFIGQLEHNVVVVDGHCLVVVRVSNGEAHGTAKMMQLQKL